MAKKETITLSSKKKTGTVRQGKNRVQTQTYVKSRNNQFVERGNSVVANTAGTNRQGNLIEKSASTIKPKGPTTILTRIQANPFTPNRKNKK